MNFDLDRLSQLAGLPQGGSRVLNEASNRSMHDDAAVSDEADHRFGKGQLSEMDDLDKHLGEMDLIDEGGDEGPPPEMEEAGHEEVEEGDGDVVLEIDEGMLKQEIRRMRQERLEENRLRTAIRGEIKSIFEDLGLDSDSSWVYGENKPKNSADGSINMGFPGVGFR